MFSDKRKPITNIAHINPIFNWFDGVDFLFLMGFDLETHQQCYSC